MHWHMDAASSEAGRVVNEDAMGVVGPLAWVLDGAGLGAAPRFSGFPTDAAWLVNEASAWLTAHAATGASLPQLLDDLQRHLTTAFGAPDETEPSGGPSACLTMARLVTPDVVDLAWIADSVALVPLPNGDVSVLTDERVKPFEARTFQAIAGLKRLDGALPPDGRAQIRVNRAAVNQPDGYAVVSPSRPWTHLVRHARVSFAPSRPILLMSDGVSRLFYTFGALTPAELVDTVAKGGATELLARLRQLERSDPEADRYPRFKIHDDATLLAVSPKP